MTERLDQAGAQLLQWLLSGSGWAFAGRISLGLVVILQNAVLARLFPPDELGIYLLFQSLVLPVVVVAVFGTDLLVVRSIGELRSRDRLEEVRDTLRDCGFIVGIMSLAGAGVLTATLLLTCSNGWIACEWATQLRFLVALLVLLSAFQLLLAGAFRGLRQIGFTSLFGGVLSSFFMLICSAAALAADISLDLTDIVYLQIGSLALAVILAVAVLRYLVPGSGTSGRLAVKPMLTAGLALMMTTLLGLIVTQSDVWIVGGFATPDVVAAYGLASRLAQLVSLPHLVLNSVLPPLMATMMPLGEHLQLERITQLSVSVASIAAVSLFLVFALAGRPLLGLLFGQFYEGAWSYLIVLSLGNVVNVAAGVCSQALIMAGRQRTLLWITFGSCCFCVVSAAIGAHFWGAIGVAVAYAAGLCLQGIVSARIALRVAGLRTYASPYLLVREFRSQLPWYS